MFSFLRFLHSSASFLPLASPGSFCLSFTEWFSSFVISLRFAYFLSILCKFRSPALVTLKLLLPFCRSYHLFGKIAWGREKSIQKGRSNLRVINEILKFRWFSRDFMLVFRLSARKCLSELIDLVAGLRLTTQARHNGLCEVARVAALLFGQSAKFDGGVVRA